MSKDREDSEAAQAPDRDKLIAFAAKIRAIETPDLATAESVTRFNIFQKFLESALENLER